jgi:hypothetical protein
LRESFEKGLKTKKRRVQHTEAHSLAHLLITNTGNICPCIATGEKKNSISYSWHVLDGTLIYVLSIFWGSFQIVCCNGIFWLWWNISLLATPSCFDIFRYVTFIVYVDTSCI